MKTKKAFILIPALACCFSILADCSGSLGNSNAGDGNAKIVAVPFKEKVTIKMYMNDNKLLDVEGCYEDTMIEKLINVDLKITETQELNSSWVCLHRGSFPIMCSLSIPMPPSLQPPATFPSVPTVW